jgi:hypothetical protein
MPREAGQKIILEIGVSRKAMANLTRDIMHRLMEFAIDSGHTLRQSLRPDQRLTGLEPNTLGPITSSLLMRNVGLSVRPNVLPTQFYSIPAKVAVMP